MPTTGVCVDSGTPMIISKINKLTNFFFQLFIAVVLESVDSEQTITNKASV